MNPLSYLHDQLEQWRAEGTFQRLRVLQSESAAEPRFDAKQVINLPSNNYLSLASPPNPRCRPSPAPSPHSPPPNTHLPAQDQIPPRSSMAAAPPAPKSMYSPTRPPPPPRRFSPISTLSPDASSSSPTASSRWTA